MSLVAVEEEGGERRVSEGKQRQQEGACVWTLFFWFEGHDAGINRLSKSKRLEFPCHGNRNRRVSEASSKLSLSLSATWGWG